MAEENLKELENEIIKHFDEKTEESKQHFDEKTEETKRHFDVVAEDLKKEIKIVAEQVGSNTEKLEEHTQRFDKINDTLEIIKIDIGFIKNDLKQKINRDEFAVLEKRVGSLEAKVNA